MFFVFITNICLRTKVMEIFRIAKAKKQTVLPNYGCGACLFSSGYFFHSFLWMHSNYRFLTSLCLWVHFVTTSKWILKPATFGWAVTLMQRSFSCLIPKILQAQRFVLTEEHKNINLLLRYNIGGGVNYLLLLIVLFTLFIYFSL